MSKQIWKPGNMLYPLPAVLVSCADKKGNKNMLTIAWTGTICSDPAMLYVSVRPSRYSYNMIKETGEFVVNLTNEKLKFATDWCGVKSGRDFDKFKECNLTPEKASTLEYAPVIAESPVSIECKTKEIIKLGSHDMFIADVTAVQVDEAFLDDKGKFDLTAANLIAYSHGEYSTLNEKFGTFGWSVKK
ncbi:MAG: flavin reductase family protein [Lachnospiraceae bacterium]|nr:flavin reductase family protein [Lachnospiraceae bacterium]